MINRPSLDGEGLENLLKPNTELESFLLKLTDFRYGMLWGEPRFGHPEGKVAYHVREVLDNVERLDIHAHQKEKLRLIAIVHDTFKYEEARTIAQGNRVHHGVIAKNFFSEYTADNELLTIIELHDEAYYCWRMIHLNNDYENGMKRLELLLEKIESCLQLYYYFFKCDTRTGDKIQVPLKWFEKNIKGIEIVDW